MARRITGTEMEYDIAIRTPEGVSGPISDKLTARAFLSLPFDLKKIPQASVGGYLSNGARLYQDVGARIEYATPEDGEIEGTLANEFAGEQVMQAMMEKLKNGQEDVGDFSINKRVIGENQHGRIYTWGYHENYSTKLLDKRGDLAFSVDSLCLLGMHLATRTLYTGAGGIISARGGKKAGFVIAQKMLDLETDMSGSTTKDKPLINTRFEPHASPDVMRRQHVTSGDANMSPWATRMKIGTTSLVLALIERGYTLPSLRMRYDEMHVFAKQVALDPTLSVMAELKNGNSISAVDIQGEIVKAVRKHEDELELTDEEAVILEEWEQVYEAFSLDPTKLRNKVEWMAKLHYLEGYMAKHGFEWSDEELEKKDYQWSLLDPARSIGLALRRTLWRPFMPSEGRVTERTTTAPPTRAQARAEFIKEVADVDIGESEKGPWVDWTHARYPKDARQREKLDPWDTERYVPFPPESDQAAKNEQAA